MSEFGERAIERVGIVGGGIMGSGIAEICARAGVDVVLVDTSAKALEKARGRIAGSLEKAVARGKLDTGAADAAARSIAWETDRDSLADRELVIEAVVESKSVKLELFSDLADVVGGGGRRLEHLLEPDRRSRPRRLYRERAADPLPAVDSDVRAGLASAEAIDDGMVKGCAHPMGPLALADLVRLDTVLGVAETLYAEQREPQLAPPPLLQRLVAAGLLGRKTGRGLYSYQ